MFERAAEGFVGLFLFISHWLSPGVSTEEIHVAALRQAQDRLQVECAIAIDWSEQLGDLIDAGIPLRFRMAAYSDAGDTVLFVRTLRFDISSSTYAFRDTFDMPSRSPDSVNASRAYQQALIAMRDYCRWAVGLKQNTGSFYIEAVLLPSRASRLNRTVDMSNVCGCRKFTRTIVMESPENARPRRGKSRK
jgi:hypothetical protein